MGIRSLLGGLFGGGGGELEWETLAEGDGATAGAPSGRAAEPAGIPARPRDGEPLSLSYGQQRLWFLDQLQPDDRAYNVPATVRLQGPLDVGALSWALDQIVARHETLRSRVPTVDGSS